MPMYDYMNKFRVTNQTPKNKKEEEEEQFLNY